MTRFLTSTAIVLALGAAPALAETQTISMPQTLETPKSVAPEQESSVPEPSAAASTEASPFLVKQESSDLLVANLIGQQVVNADNESIGEITDLITDKDGKIVAVLIGAGGFLGIGEKDVAIRYEDIKVTRDENNDLTVMTPLSKDMIAAAPDYATLDEQQIILGEKSDREDNAQ